MSSPYRGTVAVITPVWQRTGTPRSAPPRRPPRSWSRTACWSASVRARPSPSCCRRSPRAASRSAASRPRSRPRLAPASWGSRSSRSTRVDQLEIAIDGADQVAPDGWLVKGGGGAHTREKIVAAAADRFVVIADSSKPVESIAPPIPLELLRFGLAGDPGLARGRRPARRGGAVARRRADRRLPRRGGRSGPARGAALRDTGRRRPRPVLPRDGRRGSDRARRDGRAARPPTPLSRRSEGPGGELSRRSGRPRRGRRSGSRRRCGPARRGSIGRRRAAWRARRPCRRR